MCFFHEIFRYIRCLPLPSHENYTVVYEHICQFLSFKVRLQVRNVQMQNNTTQQSWWKSWSRNLLALDLSLNSAQWNIFPLSVQSVSIKITVYSSPSCYVELTHGLIFISYIFRPHFKSGNGSRPNKLQKKQKNIWYFLDRASLI